MNIVTRGDKLFVRDSERARCELAILRMTFSGLTGICFAIAGDAVARWRESERRQECDGKAFRRYW